MDGQHDTGSVQISHLSVRGMRLRIARRTLPDCSSPPLLLFNGLGVNLAILIPFMQALKQTSSLTFDLPGIGGSARRWMPMGLTGLAWLTRELLDQLALDTVDALGLSWGGGLAQEFAHRCPRSCRRLVLASSSPGHGMTPPPLPVLLELASPRRYIDRAYLRRSAGRLYGGRFATDQRIADDYVDRLAPYHSPLNYYAQLGAAFGWSSLPWLHRLTQPALILAGREDPILPRDNARLLASRIPASRLIELDDGHLFLFSSPHETARLVEAFLLAEDPLSQAPPDRQP